VARVPLLDHLLAMTDDTGLIQHATYDVPNRSTGYCTDDIARGLAVAVRAAARPETADAGARLVTIYLAFLRDAQMSDGWFHNFMGYDRTWQDRRGTPDAFGRALWGLGTCVALAPRESWRSVAAELVERALPHVDELEHLRSRAYAVLGLAQALAIPGAQDALAAAAGTIGRDFARHRRPDWIWCESRMTYDNARLPEALLRAGCVLERPDYLDAGRAMLDFYAATVFEDGIFVPVGNDGWYPRGGPKARFGQQPLEAAAMVDASVLAAELFGDERYREWADRAFAWFYGANSHGALMVRNGGCRDGIDAHGPSANMGAESTLAYASSAFALAEHAPQRIARIG
jgi:hypothetical protein